ncbi:hypothetical protein [Roseobacter ponti]|uniref:GNAT family N-acetyltransferase n=1 Tax=Roseobacter ponti TaxID=1891787 RepID=A0A858SUZ6_9RHOB|nr:hypothetical protein [Roseobacter ponti]QJF51808.1 hypothetical protein G3256_11860 [Roseobacter ponti]
MKPHPDFENIDVPQVFSLADYHLKILTKADLDEDYAAVMNSAAVLQGLFDPQWPVGMTRDEDLTDLEWHHREFTARRSFAWVIRDAAGGYLGCAYLAPDIGTRGRGAAVWWFTDTPGRMAHLSAFGPLYEHWLRQMLPETYQLDLHSNAHL